MPETDEVDSLVQRLRDDIHRRDELVGLLHETAPVHAGRSATATARSRALILAALGNLGCPDSALPFVIEELDTGNEALLVAAAARATHGREPDPGLAHSLMAALRNNAGLDDTVNIDTAEPRQTSVRSTTALIEVLHALARHGDNRVLDQLRAFRAARAHLLAPAVLSSLDDLVARLPTSSCCATAPAHHEPQPTTSGAIPDVIEVEDQDGNRFTLADFLRQGPTVVAFFYTRCGNPRKCSLTITSLGRLCQELAARSELDFVQVAAITYDPGYDVPGRLRRYGTDRGFPFGPTARMLRAPIHHDLLQGHLDLQVTYSASVVSRHAVELYLLDRDGTIRWTWARKRWHPSDVLAGLAALPPATTPRT